MPAVIKRSATGTHVYLVVLENHSYAQMVGSASMPYLNSLITQDAVANDYFANTHPSIGNYFMLTTGQIITNDDSFSGTVSQDNVARELTSASRLWRVYAESLPSQGYLGDTAYPYTKRHNPFAYFSDVVNSTAEAANIVPFSAFSSDLNAGATGDLNLIIPNLQDDMHDCPASNPVLCSDADREQAADTWLQTNLAPLLADSDFQQRGLLIITVDESVDTDTANGGGHVVTVFGGPKAKSAYASSNLYQHQSLLNLMCQQAGCAAQPGAAAGAAAMSEFLK